MSFSHQPAFTVGKFLVSPLVTRTDTGRYAASVSISSGHGRAAHHRVLRFVRRFDSRDQARRYAVEEGLAFLEQLSYRPHPRSSVGQRRTD